MKLGENISITLPSCITSSMKGDKFTLSNENMEKQGKNQRKTRKNPNYLFFLNFPHSGKARQAYCAISRRVGEIVITQI